VGEEEHMTEMGMARLRRERDHLPPATNHPFAEMG